MATTISSERMLVASNWTDQKNVEQREETIPKRKIYIDYGTNDDI
jgi:hypothetical protein